MKIQEVIEELCHSPKEAKIYLASLSMGESTTSEIAREVGIPRTTANFILEKLKERGLMKCYLQRRRRLWLSEEPEKILHHLKEKQATFEEILPALESMKKTQKPKKPSLRMYTGSELKRIYFDIIKEKSHILAIFDFDKVVKVLGEDFLQQMIKKRHSIFLRIKVLAPKTPLAVKYSQRDASEMRMTHFFRSGTAIKNANFIYGKKVAIASLNKRSPMGLIIEDEDLADTMRELFELLWNTSSSF